MIKNGIAAMLISATSLASAEAQVVDGQTYGEQRFGSWTGLYVAHADDHRFRSFAQGNGNWAISIDTVPPDCAVMVTIILSMHGESLQQDIAPTDFYGVLRVDQNDVWNVKFHTQGAMGDKSMMYTAYALPGIGTLLSQMRDGQTLRAKLTVSGSDYYSTYPLNGFGSTFDAEFQTCVGATTKAPKPKPALQPKAGERIL
jgi:hypothetical protein